MTSDVKNARKLSRRISPKIQKERNEHRSQVEDFEKERERWRRETEETVERNEKHAKETKSKLRFELNQEMHEREMALKKDAAEEERRMKSEVDELMQQVRIDWRELEEKEVLFKREMEEKEIKLKREIEEREFKMKRDLDAERREMNQSLEEERKHLEYEHRRVLLVGEEMVKKMKRATWKQWMDVSDVVKDEKKSMFPTCFTMLPYKLMDELRIGNEDVKTAETMGLLLGNAMHAIVLLSEINPRDGNGDKALTNDSDESNDNTTNKLSSYSAMNQKMLMNNTETSFVDICEGIVTRANNAVIVLAEILSKCDANLSDPTRDEQLIIEEQE